MSTRIFLFGEDIDTDQLAPGRYMREGLPRLAAHCLETVRPDFASTVRIGDIVVAGRNFGMGSSREQAAEALKHLGVAAVIAPSFAGIFYRNALNLGLPALLSEDLTRVEDGDAAALDLEASVLRLTKKRLDVALRPLPANLQAMLADGGLVPHLKKRLAAERDLKKRESLPELLPRDTGGEDTAATSSNR